MEHKLKMLPEYFEAVKSGSKTFEVRRDDRGFQAGDILFLQEYENGEYTGAGLKVMVTYVLRDTEYCKEGYCIMGIKLKAVNSKTTIISRVSGLVTLPVCFKCGRGPLLDTYSFCPYCGRIIDNGGKNHE